LNLKMLDQRTNVRFCTFLIPKAFGTRQNFLVNNPG